MSPKVCIGMVIYNGAEYLSETLDSLLGQTFKTFQLILVDDCSTDSSEQIALQYTSLDKRVSYFKNHRRMGYVENCRIAFNYADDDIDYFTWASDHDVYHSTWLETMVKTLNDNPDVILAYPLTVRISRTGERLSIPSPILDTVGLNTHTKIAVVCLGKGFGNMVYGLFRASTLRRVGVLPKTLLPDRLWLTQLCLEGSFQCIRKELWFRRQNVDEMSLIETIKRQRRTLFSRPPWYTYIPWCITHTVLLLWNTIFKPQYRSLSKIMDGFFLSLTYFTFNSLVQIRSSTRQITWINNVCRLMKLKRTE